MKSVEMEEEKPREVVHVRARRGQATDSHSLAERVITNLQIIFTKHSCFSKQQKQIVFGSNHGLGTNESIFHEFQVRRGKINDRLRCLQDIVPGCYKVN